MEAVWMGDGYIFVSYCNQEYINSKVLNAQLNILA